MKLKARASLVILGLLLLGQGFYSGIYYYLERRSEMTEMYRQARESVRLAASICHESALTGDWRLPKEHLRTLRQDPAVRYAECLDGDGRALAHSDPQRVGMRQIQARHRPAGRVWEVSHSIRVPGRKFGVARIGFDAAVIESLMRERLLHTLWLMAQVTAITLSFGLLAAILIAHTLTRPIEALAAATREISSGNLDYRVPDEGRQDELGTLARRFNEMAERLSELSRMKEQVVSSLTHDLKNPLASIKGAVETMLSGDIGPLTDKQKKYLGSSLDSALRLWGYLDDILDVTRLQAGRFPMNIEPTPVKKLVDSVLEDQRPKAEEGGVRLAAELVEELPRVKADFEQIHRVLDNLIANALKFTPPEGSITVAVGPDGDCVRFMVRDTGKGIPAGEIDKVFEDFYQVDGTKRGVRGIGMGLAICDRIVREHGGRIWVESELDRGTTFFFTLPAVDKESEPA